MSDDLTNYERRITLTNDENWKFNYDICKKRFIYDAIHGNPIADNEEDFEDIKNWMEEYPNWIDILFSNDVALFPKALEDYKNTFISNMNREFNESLDFLHNREGFEDNYLYNLRHFGVFRFDCMVGHQMMKKVLEFLDINRHDFAEQYGESLVENINCLDDLVLELTCEQDSSF